MTKTITLAQCRDELRKELESYRALPEYILDGVGAGLQWLINRKAVTARATFLPPNASDQENQSFPSYWINGLAIGLFTFLLGLLISWLTGHAYSNDEYWLTGWAALTGGLALVANKVNIRAFLNTFHDSCLDKMLKVENIRDLEEWLSDNFKWWKPLFSGILIGPALGLLLYVSWLRNLPQNSSPNISPNYLVPQFHAGPLLTILLAGIPTVWVGYYLIPFYVAFPARFHR